LDDATDLINTIHEQKPIPSIYIRHSIDVTSGKSVREVVDGQQRFAAVLDYVNDKFAARHPKHPKPVKFSALSRSEKHQFLTTSLSIGYLLGGRPVPRPGSRTTWASQRTSPAWP
jgi:uncharacterized protein with ParB-like and HNH nuclease domain